MPRYLGVFMKIKLFIIISLFTAAAVGAQTTSVKPSALTGDVTSISASTIVLQTKDGAVNVELQPTTEFKRVPPENPSLKTAVASSASEIGEGDKLLVTGILSDDKKTLPARAVYLMSQSDISKKRVADAQKWAARGLSGRVASVNAETGQMMVEVRGLMGTQSVTVTPRSNAKFLRYKQDSIRYDEAVQSRLGDIAVGDMVRALGERSGDGLSFTAEEIVTGAFRTIAGTVKSIDVASNTIVLTDLQSSKDVTVAIGAGSALKKFPEEMAQRMAQAGGGQPGAAGQPGQAGQRPQAPAGGPPAGGVPGQGRGGMGGGARGGIDDMFERFDAITIGDLKPGDMIAVSSTRNGVEDRVTAIKLLAGVEPFIRAAQAQQNNGGRGRTGQSGGFTIPGLDGLDFP
jgi:hypothetical protein